MPKAFATSSIGIPLVFNGPATIEEYKEAGGDILEDAVRGLIAWDTLPDWQSQFADKIKELTGAERAVNQAATDAAKKASENPDKVKPILETVTKYVKRVFAGVDEAARKELIKAGQDLALTINIDPSPTRRTSKPKAEYLAKADTWLALDKDALEGKISQGLEFVPGYPLDRDDDGKPERDSLARFISAYVDAKVKAEI